MLPADVERSMDSVWLGSLDLEEEAIGEVSVPLFVRVIPTSVNEPCCGMALYADKELEEGSRILAAGVLLREIQTPSTSIPLSIARIPKGMLGPSSIRRLFWTMTSLVGFSFCFCFCFFGPLRILKLRMILFSRLIGW
jgi:hypothetical protein